MIKYFHLKQHQPKSKQDLRLLESDPSFSVVKNWVAEFKGDRLSTNDEHRSGRPNTVTAPDMIKKVHRIVNKKCTEFLLKN